MNDVYNAISNALGGNGWDVQEHQTKAQAIAHIDSKRRVAEAKVVRLEKAIRALTGGDA